MKLGVCAVCTGIVFACFALVAFGTAQAANPVVLPAKKPIRVHVRIEAPDRTLFNGVVATVPRGFTTQAVPGTSCDGLTVRAFVPQSPSPLTALNDALTAAGSGFWSDPAAFTWGDQVVGTRGMRPGVKLFSYGPEVCRIGRYVADPATGAGWRVKVNNAGGGAGAATLPTAQIGAGASVLWYWSDPSVQRTLDLKLPARVVAGKQFNGHVDAWDNATDQLVSAALVKVQSAGRTVQSNAGGDFTMRLGVPGIYVIGTGAAGAARGSDVICVYRRGGGGCGTGARRR